MPQLDRSPRYRGRALSAAVLFAAVPRACAANARPPPPRPVPMPPDCRRTVARLPNKPSPRAPAAPCHQTRRPARQRDAHLGCCDCHGGDPYPRQESPRARGFPMPGPPPPSVRSYTLPITSRRFVRFVTRHLRASHRLRHGQRHAKKCCRTERHDDPRLHALGAPCTTMARFPVKPARSAKATAARGPQRLQTVPPRPNKDAFKACCLSRPAAALQISQPGNLPRFGARRRFRLETGIPERLEDPAAAQPPHDRASAPRTTDPVFTAAEDRLSNPRSTSWHQRSPRRLSLHGSRCHNVYANDRSRVHPPYAVRYGAYRKPDPTIPKDQPGHPIQHRFTRTAVFVQPPGTNVLNSYAAHVVGRRRPTVKRCWIGRPAGPGKVGRVLR